MKMNYRQVEISLAVMKMDFEVPSQLCKAKLPWQCKDHYPLLGCTKPEIFWLQEVEKGHVISN